jgi:subtilisin family serine protease
MRLRIETTKPGEPSKALVARRSVLSLLALAFIASSIFAHAPLQDYALILQDGAVSTQIRSRAELQSRSARKQLQTISAAQSRLQAELARRHIAVTGSVQLLLNAVFVRVPADRAGELRSLPGVRAVEPLPRVHRHLDQAVQLVGVPDAWNAVGGQGNAGAGVKIGVIDTGIDQTHAAFQDSSLSVPDGFPKGDPSFTNNKVIVARSYVDRLVAGDGTPAYDRPDDVSPRDHSGHGTAVAMIAAGATNTGPLATITGIAPKAWLGSYKVFGTPGVNDYADPVIPQALDDAFADGMDIVVLPFGAQPAFQALTCPNNDCDQDKFSMEQAVRKAVSLGMTVVISAGNDGQLNSINTPGTVPDAITVGSSSNMHVLYAAVVAGGATMNALFGDAPRPAQAVTAPLSGAGMACNALPAGSLNGAIALIQRGSCDFNIKINNAQAAGAVGAIVYQSPGGGAPFPMLGLLDTGIPAVMVGESDGAALQSASQATIDPALSAQSTVASVVSPDSSRGPAIGDSSIKPELVAVGTGIYTATQTVDPNGDLYNATGYVGVSGNSFAAAMVAGAAALVKQNNLGFRPGQIKSALVNSATQDVTDNAGTARIVAVGAGKLNVAAALGTSASIEPATLSFGAVTALPISLTLNLTNTGNSGATFNLTASPRDNDNNAQVNITPAAVTLNSGETRQVSVQLTGTRPAPGSYEGYVNISGGNSALKVPYLYLAGDGIPANIFPVSRGSFSDVVNQTDLLLLFKLVDQYGLPARNSPVTFKAVTGGRVTAGDSTTDIYGLAGAVVNLGSQPGDQIFTGTAGSLTVEFDGVAYAVPTITSVSNAVPGATATINGTSLSHAAKSIGDGHPAIQLAGVSVSFDAPGVRAPGLLTAVSPTQLSVQIPPELAGQPSAQIKVRVGDIFGSVYTVALSNAPAADETAWLRTTSTTYSGYLVRTPVDFEVQPQRGSKW